MNEDQYWRELLNEEIYLHRQHFDIIVEQTTRPSSIYNLRLFIDGDKWCALYGENLQDGVAGFGNSPAEAYENFDKEWNEKVEVRCR